MSTWVIIAVVGVLAVVVLCTSVRILKQYERGVQFRLGRLKDGPRGPGLIFIIPLVDHVRRVSLRIVTMPIQSQGIITRDNVSVDIAAVAYYRVKDPVRSVVAIEDVAAAIDQIAQTTLRSVVGQHTLDEALAETETINQHIREILDVQTEDWGVEVTLVELKDIQLPDSMKRAMAKQAEAEREKRAKIIAAEGEALAAGELADASDIMMAHPLALQLRNLQTLIEISVEKNSTIVFPAPLMSTIQELGAFLRHEGESAQPLRGPAARGIGRQRRGRSASRRRRELGAGRMTLVRTWLLASAVGLAFAASAGAQRGVFETRTFAEPARPGLAVTGALSGYRVTSVGRVVVPTGWRSLAAPAGTLRFLTGRQPELPLHRDLHRQVGAGADPGCLVVRHGGPAGAQRAAPARQRRARQPRLSRRAPARDRRAGPPRRAVGRCADQAHGHRAGWAGGVDRDPRDGGVPRGRRMPLGHLAAGARADHRRLARRRPHEPPFHEVGLSDARRLTSCGEPRGALSVGPRDQSGLTGWRGRRRRRDHWAWRVAPPGGGHLRGPSFAHGRGPVFDQAGPTPALATQLRPRRGLRAAVRGPGPPPTTDCGSSAG